MEVSSVKGFFQNTFGQVVASLLVIIALGIGAAFFAREPDEQAATSLKETSQSTSAENKEISELQIQASASGTKTAVLAETEIQYTIQSDTINLTRVIAIQDGKDPGLSDEDSTVSRSVMKLENKSSSNLQNITIEFDFIFASSKYIASIDKSDKYLSDDIEIKTLPDRIILKIKNFYGNSYIKVNADSVNTVYFNDPKSDSTLVDFKRIII